MESTTINNNINAIKEIRKLFNGIRSNLSREEINKIREKLYKNEATYDSLKEKEQIGSLTNEEKKVLKNIDRYLKNISMHLKNLKKLFKKYQYGLDYLFNKLTTLNNDINVLKDARKLLMSVEVIFYVKKQRDSEKNSIKKKLLIIL